MTLTKARIVEELVRKGVSTKSESAKIVDVLFELIKQTLEAGEDVLITGFGKLCVKTKHTRRGRNPQTGKLIVLPARRIVTFKCSGILREKMNAPEAGAKCG